LKKDGHDILWKQGMAFYIVFWDNSWHGASGIIFGWAYQITFYRFFGMGDMAFYRSLYPSGSADSRLGIADIASIMEV